MKAWYVYCLYLRNYTYVGATVDVKKRLQKHNGELKGGAKYTTSKGPGWKCAIYVSGFKNNIDALQFEWAWKHINPKGKGIPGRLIQLQKLLCKKQWTSKAVSAINYELDVRIVTPEFLIDEIEVPDYINLMVDEGVFKDEKEMII
jgi:predicted GIY-YIG superfamily endonuclease